MEADMLSPASQAAAIFSQGPETLVKESHAVVAGQPARVATNVEEQTTGTDAIPVRWTISGEIEKPVWLKGKAEAGHPLSFRRAERAMFAIMDSSTPDWELELGSIAQAAAVVLFYVATEPHALPSPKGGPDLVKFVSDVVRIQSIAEEPERIRAWIDYASQAPWAEGRKAALRSLVASHATWGMLEPAWLKLLSDSAAPQEVRTFAFLLMIHAAAEQRWGRSLGEVVVVALATFAKESDPSTALRYADALIMLHDAGVRNPRGFPGVAELVVDAFRKKRTLGPTADEDTRSLDEAYQQMREPLIAAPARDR
jgi:hypothetical protein